MRDLTWQMTLRQEGGNDGPSHEQDAVRSVAHRMEWSANGADTTRNVHEATSQHDVCGKWLKTMREQGVLLKVVFSWYK